MKLSNPHRIAEDQNSPEALTRKLRELEIRLKISEAVCAAWKDELSHRIDDDEFRQVKRRILQKCVFHRRTR